MTRPAEELYDLKEDPWELKNLATDPAQAVVKTELSTELDRWMKQQNDRGMQAELAVTPHKSLKGE
jgi:N-sulfoglucosamine sulfohydrolase